MTLTIRSAAPADLPLICALIRDLAAYERLADAVRFDPAVLGENCSAKMAVMAPMPR